MTRFWRILTIVFQYFANFAEKITKKHFAMKRLLFYVACLTSFLTFTNSTFAQWSFGTTATLESRYVWRGQALGLNAPCIEPGATLGYKGFALDVWGAFSLNAVEYQELDWTLSWTSKNEMFKFMVTDYAFPSFSSTFHYFDYNQSSTSHVVEAGLSFAIPKIDLALNVYSNFYGADAHDINGNMVYSTYMELAYSPSWEAQNTDFDIAIGCALNGKEGYSFYGNDGFGVVNVAVGATKKLEVSSKLTIPVFARIIANPTADQMYFVCGTSIEL